MENIKKVVGGYMAVIRIIIGAGNNYITNVRKTETKLIKIDENALSNFVIKYTK